MTSFNMMESRAGITALTETDIEQYGDEVTGGWGTGILEGFILGVMATVCSAAAGGATLSTISSVIYGVGAIYSAYYTSRLVSRWSNLYGAASPARAFYATVAAAIETGISAETLRDNISNGVYGRPW